MKKSREEFLAAMKMNIPVLMSMLSGDQETDWQLSRIQEISPK